MVLGVTRPQTSSKRNDRAHSNSVIPAALESYNLTPFALWMTPARAQVRVRRECCGSKQALEAK
jgi:hypothetical protein